MIKKYIPLLIFFISLFAFQIQNLDSDPSPIIRWGTISDEGYWQHNARMKIINGDFCTDEFRMAYLGAPLFNQLLYISYKALGISLYSARIPSVISFWLILILFFLLLKRRFGTKKALFSTFLFGFMHEMLMYVKWSTPVILEICFLLAIIYFYELGIINRSRLYFLFSGISYSLAILSKLTSILFVIPLIIFFTLEIYFKRCNVKILTWFICGFSFVMAPFMLLFVSKNWHMYIHMFQNYAEGARDYNYQFIAKEFLWNILTAPLSFTIMKFPSAVILFMLSLFYFLQKFLKLALNKFKTRSLDLNTTETFSISWIIGIVLALCINNQIGVPRRMIQLYAPFFLLASYYVFNKKGNTLDLSKLKKGTILAVIISSTILISFYISSVYYMSFIKWLGIFFNDDIILKYSRTRYLLPLGFIITYFFLWRNSYKIVNIFIFTIFMVSVSLNTIWYLTATYTLRDASKTLEYYSKPSAYSVGYPLGFWLAINKITYPIWHKPTGINKKIIKEDLKTEKLLYFDGSSAPIQTDRYYYNIFGMQINKRVSEQLDYLKLVPYPFTNIYRKEIFLYIAKSDLSK